MHTVVILSDTLTHDNQNIKKIKELFPDCNVQILSKTAKQSVNRKVDLSYNALFQQKSFEK